MGIKFSNNASANIIRDLSSTATSVSVTVGKGDLFPSITEGDYFYATLAGNNGLEIVKVTNRVNDTMTIVRAQDNTTALSFDTGDLFELRIVAADFNDTFSEVNATLEAAIEETLSTVNSALSGKAPISHASSSTNYGVGTSTQYGHLKTHDNPDATLTAATGHAFTPAGAAAMQETINNEIEGLEEKVGTVREDTLAAAQQASENSAGQAGGVTLEGVAAEVASLGGEVASKADSEIDGKGVVRSVNGVFADAAGNVPLEEVGTNYIRYTNGIQMIWGEVDLGAVNSTNYTVTFPVPFVHKNKYSVMLSRNSGATTTMVVNIWTHSCTTTSFNIRGTSTTGAVWVAVGNWK